MSGANARSKVESSSDTWRKDTKREASRRRWCIRRAKFHSEESPCYLLRDAVTTVRTFPELLFSRIIRTIARVGKKEKEKEKGRINRDNCDGKINRTFRQYSRIKLIIA